MEERIKNLIVAVAGKELLAYMLNCDPADVRDKLDDAPHKVLTVLTACCLEDATSLMLAEPGQGYASTFGNPFEGDCTVAMWAHLECGGCATKPIVGDDWLAETMAKCMIDLFPFANAELHRRGVKLSHPLWLTALPRFMGSASSFMSDESLVAMCDRFGLRSEKLADSADFRLCLYPSFGAAGEVSAFTVGAALLDATVLEADSRGELGDEAACIEIAKELAGEFRRFLAGETVSARARILLSGVSFSRPESVEIDGGVVRRPTKYELEYLFGMKSSSTLVCDLHIPCYLAKAKIINANESVISPEDDKDVIGSGGELWAQLLGEVLRVRVAAILASAGGGAVSPINCAMLVNNFILCSSGYSSDVLKTVSEQAAQHAVVESENFARWHTLLGDNHLPELAMKRLVSAFEQGKAKEDSAIDLMIVLESLFGESGETVFKLSSVVSKLIAPNDLRQREEIYFQMKNAYNLRSKIVHGDERELSKLRPKLEAIFAELSESVLSVVKILLTGQKELLNYSPGNRTRRILLTQEKESCSLQLNGKSTRRVGEV